MQQIVVHIAGEAREVLVGFDILAYIMQGVEAGDYRADGYPVNPGKQVVDLLYIALPDVGFDWRWYAEQATPNEIREMFAARNAIVEAASGGITPDNPPAETEVGSEEWKSRMKVQHVD